MLFVPDETRSRLRAECEDEALLLSHVMATLRRAGLRPTRQRVALGGFLFRSGHRHATADDLHRDALDAGVSLSLATVYNTLNQFAEAELVRKVHTGSGRTYFDTDTGDHQHFYIEAEDRIIDIPPGQVRFGKLPEPPDGYVITKVDVLIRLARAEPERRGCRASGSPGCGACHTCLSNDGDRE